MSIAWLFLLILIMAGFEALTFLGVLWALGDAGRRRRTYVIAVFYWALVAAVLGAAIVGYFFGPASEERELLFPEPVILAVVAIYVPKVVLAVLTLLELLRRALVRTAPRLLAPPAAVQPGWMTQARFLPRLGLAFALLTFGAILWDATLGRNDIKVYRHEIVSESLPPELDGLRVVHLSDIHADSLGAGADRLTDRLVSAINTEKPDLVLFSGDYGQPAEFTRGPSILGRLHGRLGKYAVLGNHDFGAQERAADNWTSAEDKRAKVEALSQAFRAQGFTLLVNDAEVLSQASGKIAILGVGVYEPHHGFYDADLSAAERAAGAARFRLLIAHSPQYWEDAVRGRRPIDLTLAGHTHGAQLGVGIGSMVWSPAALQFRHWGGLYRDGLQYLNVNRGTGYVILPFRLGMPADVSVIVVRCRRRDRA